MFFQYLRLDGKVGIYSSKQCLGTAVICLISHDFYCCALSASVGKDLIRSAEIWNLTQDLMESDVPIV